MTTTTIDPTRLAEITHLSKGGHGPSAHAYCVMEAVAYVAGEPHSDHPVCACPVCTDYAIWLNDTVLSDANRDHQLLPFVERLAGSRSTQEIETQRRDIGNRAMADYQRERAPIRADYERKRAAIWADYEREHAPIWADYQREHAAIRADYQRKRAAIWADYERKHAAIRADYQRKRAPIRADYERKRAAIWADYERKRAPIRADYERERAPIAEGPLAALRDMLAITS